MIHNEDLFCFSVDDFSSDRVKELSFKKRRQFNPLLFIDTLVCQTKMK